jgi:PTS system fructose-specific IIA component/PTS system nitrogen regulatory IIA component
MSEVILPNQCVILKGDGEKAVVIREMVNGLVADGKVKKKDVDALVAGALDREAIGSTGIGHGIAIPHCRTELIKQLTCIYGRSDEGVDFDSLDGEPVYSVFLLLTPIDQKERHLALMKNFASQIRKEHFCEFLRQNSTIAGLIALLKEFESK